MIYCVVPEALADELYDKLVSYYAEDNNVKVIIDRREADRRGRGGQSGGAGREHERQRRDRRRPRVPGEFPPLEAPDA